MNIVIRDKEGKRVDLLRCKECGVVVGVKRDENLYVHVCGGKSRMTDIRKSNTSPMELLKIHGEG